MGKDVTPLADDLRLVLARVAEQIGQAVYPQGLPQGTTFSDLESLAGLIGDEIGRSMIEAQTRAQADAFVRDPAPAVCPTCGRAARSGPDEHRILITTQGVVDWEEPVVHCSSCRRDFFPSGPSFGA